MNGNDSNAALAKLLGLKVILVIDCEGMTRGIAPLLNGYKSFDQNIKYHGLILNQVNGARHEDKLISSIRKYTSMRVLGSIWRNKNLIITEQHLGLQPNFLDASSHKKIQVIKKTINESVDISKFTSDQKKNHIPAVSTSLNTSKNIKILLLG